MITATVALCLTLVFLAGSGQDIVEEYPNTTPWPNSQIATTVDYHDGSIVAPDTSGLDESNDGQADNLADYVMKKIEQYVSGARKDENDSNLPPVNEANTEDLNNCSVPVSLDRYCGQIPGDVQAYFSHDLSIDGVVNTLLKPSVIEALRNSCSPGEWCLPDTYHQDIINGMDSLYLSGPICSEAMWSCLQSIIDVRFDCQDQKLNILVNTVLLMCDLKSLGNLSPECYARTTEAVYVTLEDLTNPSGSRHDELQKEDCNAFRVKMAKSYLCADESCDYDQDVILAKFERWAGLALKAVSIAKNCNISSQCPTDKPSNSYYDNNGDKDSDDDSEHYKEYEDKMEKIEEEIENEIEEEEKEGGQQDGTTVAYGDENFDNNFVADNEGGVLQSRAVLFGLITMTTVLVLGLLILLFTLYKRYKRCKFISSKRGYSQLSDEETKMLKSEYN